MLCCAVLCCTVQVLCCAVMCCAVQVLCCALYCTGAVPCCTGALLHCTVQVLFCAALLYRCRPLCPWTRSSPQTSTSWCCLALPRHIDLYFPSLLPALQATALLQLQNGEAPLKITLNQHPNVANIKKNVTSAGKCNEADILNQQVNTRLPCSLLIAHCSLLIAHCFCRS